MANKTISALPSASTLNGAEFVPIVQDGQTVKVTVEEIVQTVVFPVSSVNGYDGAVNLTNEDLGAFPSTGGTISGATTISTGGLTVSAGGATITAGGLTVTAGGATVSTGNLAVSAGNITASGNISGSATPSTGMTSGFVYIPKITTAPSGTPTAISGYAPMVLDGTISPNRLYIHNGTAWKYVVLSA